MVLSTEQFMKLLLLHILILFGFVEYRFHSILPHFFKEKLMVKEWALFCTLNFRKVTPRNFHCLFKKASE